MVQIYGLGLGHHDPTKAQRVFGPVRTTISTLWPGTTWPKSILDLLGLSLFSPKHDGLGSRRTDPILSTMPGGEVAECNSKASDE